MRGAFFGILGARALHRLVFLTELVVQLERTPRGIVLGDDGLERDDHAAAAKRQEQRVELRTGKTAEHEHLVGKARGRQAPRHGRVHLFLHRPRYHGTEGRAAPLRRV